MVGDFEIKKAVEKIYRGSYTYHQNDTLYGEEVFEVFRLNADYSHRFETESTFRLSNGEILQIKIRAHFSKEWLPLAVSVQKTLGAEIINEVYSYNPQYNKVDYYFESEDFQKKLELNTAPKFSLVLPSVATSAIFLSTKKIDTSGKGAFSLMSNPNFWVYKDSPFSIGLEIERVSSSMEQLIINKKKLKCHLYVANGPKDLLNKGEEINSFRYYVSQYANIPYLVQHRNLSFQIKYFNNLEE